MSSCIVAVFVISDISLAVKCSMSVSFHYKCKIETQSTVVVVRNLIDSLCFWVVVCVSTVERIPSLAVLLKNFVPIHVNEISFFACLFSHGFSLHPAVFRAELRPYQRQGADWMKKKESEDDDYSTSSVAGDNLHPMWDEFEFPDMEKKASSSAAQTVRV